MAKKRLTKELECWKVGKIWPEEETFLNERTFWTVVPFEKKSVIDIFNWKVVLRPAQGPFAGGHIAWHLSFPSDYPFKPPKIHKMLSCGPEVSFESVSVGTEVQFTPMGQPDRRLQGTVEEKCDDCLLIRIFESDGGTKLVEHMDNWNSQATPLLADLQVTIWHPCVDPSGGICKCGIEDSWAPRTCFAEYLAFLRVAVEEARCEGMMPVPTDTEKKGCERCFCVLNHQAQESHSANPDRWFRDARRRFFASFGVLPLCVHAVSSRPDEVDIVCTNLAGETLANFILDPMHKCLEDLQKAVVENVPLPRDATEWQIVFSDGSSLDDSRYQDSLSSVLAALGRE